ncbi:MAG: shikimate dehydrogenase [Polaromonas sp.]|uniref:shikimate dehydrogenase n=1 Tax=Polaromonas sp. TaxID=1869339 RepID=UPI002734FB24|nr:shikimate dehydrogenase [Polaromonas sp.]MDP2820061.1 shikimate dehydrogenase [Polaromonas sp.]
MGAVDFTEPPETRMLAGLIGTGIRRSLTPVMQEAEARHHGIRLHYQLIDLHEPARAIAMLPQVLEAARAMGFAGLNVTYPCKQAVLPYLDELSPEAAAMGAVNTVVLRDGRLIGHNTDGSGWRWGFQRALPEAGLSRVVLLGAGGAGSAIAHAVLRMGAGELLIVDPDTSRAGKLAAALNTMYGARSQAVPDAEGALKGASGLIHATPTGMDKLPGMPLSARLLRPDLWVAEIVYFPLETELLRQARACGCQVVDGGTMAVGQAIGAFELLTGRQASPQRMEAHFRQLVAPDKIRAAHEPA